MKKHSNALRGNGWVFEVFFEGECWGGESGSLLHPMQSTSGLLAGGSAPNGEDLGSPYLLQPCGHLKLPEW